MNRTFLFASILLAIVCCKEQSNDVEIVYWGSEFPNDSAIIFSPEHISIKESREGNGVFSNDGSRFFFTQTDFFNNVSIQQMDLSGTIWSSPVKASFSDTGDNWEAAPSPNGEYVVFLSNRSNQVRPLGKPWMSLLDSNGLWQAPRPILLPIPESEGIGHPYIDMDHIMYYSAFLPGGRGNIDIYFSDLSADSLATINLGAPVNSESDELQPSLAADKSFLLFTSNRPGGYGKYDIYISFLNDSIWSEPKNLGPKINTEHDEFSAWATPDGRFVLFDRVIGREQDIYWISADILDEVSDNDQ